MDVTKDKAKNKGKNKGKRGCNSETHFKPGQGGRPKGAKNRMPPIDLIPQDVREKALLAFSEGIEAKKPEYVLWLLGRMVPPPKPEPTIINLQFDDLDLTQLDGLRSAGVRVAQALANGTLSIEESESVLKIIQAQNGLVYNELMEHLIKFAREHRNNPDAGVAGKVLMTEEEFNKLYDACKRRPIVYQGNDDPT